LKFERWRFFVGPWMNTVPTPYDYWYKYSLLPSLVDPLIPGDLSSFLIFVICTTREEHTIVLAPGFTKSLPTKTILPNKQQHRYHNDEVPHSQYYYSRVNAFARTPTNDQHFLPLQW
jgi:hypothetical protein